MRVYRGLTLLTLAPAYAKDGRGLCVEDLGIIESGAIAFDDRKIHWLGDERDLPSTYSSSETIRLTGHVLTPAMVDSHTHLLFGGDRAHEYAQRLNGIDYQTIAKIGGGILYSRRETLKLSEDQLFQLGCDRLGLMASYGVGAVEMKSGYALTLEGELTLLRAMKRLKDHFRGRIRLFSTYLGAHAVPKEFATTTEFVKTVVIPTLHAAHGENLVDGVDVFHEEGYFSTDDTRLIFREARELGVKTKIHADEFLDNGGAGIAASSQSLSADHLLRTGADGIKALASSGTVATLLPGTAFFLGKPLANARGLLDAGAKVAIATDYNPGSCHWDNLLMIASIAAPSLKMNQAEMWAAITLNGAHALGFQDQGALVPGLLPAFSLFRADTPSQITYNWGHNLAVPLP